MNKENQKMIITRFAPSPTGVLHIGGARTALFNYLFTKKHKGEFILRIDDTDKERSKKEYEEEIISSLSWLGIKSDRQLIYQSERTQIYQDFIKKLIDNDFAYISKEKEGEREEVIRFRNPNKKIVFDDLIRGRVEFDTTDLKDFVIAKSLTEPIYHLASVIDDFEFGITHIIRAEEHLSNTPRQILLLEAIGAPRPIYAHIPLVLAPDRSKLSKRHGAVSVQEFLEKGYEALAFVNYLALLGWHPSDDQEIFNFEELIQRFELERVQKGGAIWSEEKLAWINKEHLKLEREKIETDIIKELGEKTKKISKESMKKIADLVFERISRRGEIKELIASEELKFFFEDPKWNKQDFLWKGQGDILKTTALLRKVLEILHSDNLKENWSSEKIKEEIWPLADKEGRGEVLWPFRFALSGLKKSPDPFMISEILGREITITRLNQAISFLENV